MKEIKFYLIIFSLILSRILPADISGYVVDKETGESIPGVNIFLQGTHAGTSSDLNGFFVLRGIKPGKYILVLSHISYSQKELRISLSSEDLYLGKIELESRIIKGKAVIVTAKKEAIISKETSISTYQINPVILQELPQLNQDIFKALRLSPSVTISDPLSPQLYIRGSDPGENLVLLDGMTIYNPQHFLSAEAIFNPYSIKDITFMVGGFPARYGGRNSSVLAITTRDGHKSEVHGEFSPSVNGISTAVEFPVSPTITSMFSGRVYSDLIYRFLMGSPNILADYNFTITKRTERSKLKLSSFYARDFLKWNAKHLFIFFPEEWDQDFEELFKTSTANLATGIRYHFLITPRILLDVHSYYSQCRSYNKSILKQRVEEVYINLNSEYDNRVSELSIKPELTLFAFTRQTFKVGFDIKRYQFINKYIGYQNKRFTRKENFDIRAFYFQNKIDIGLLLLNAGLRFSATQDYKSKPEERLSLTTNMGKIKVKIALGTYRQLISTLNTNNEEFVKFLEYYIPLRGYPPITSKQKIVEIEYTVSEHSKLSISSYYKNMKRLYRIVSKSTEMPFKNIFIERGRGRAYGIEFLISVNTPKLVSWISYTYSRGFRTFPSINNGREFAYDADQPHNLKIATMIIPNNYITFSLSMQIASGYPKTWTNRYYWYFHYDPYTNDISISPSFLTPEKNNVRFPPRVALDIGLKKRLRMGFGAYLADFLQAKEAILNFTIKNVLFLYRNPYCYAYIPGYGYYGFAVNYFPSIQAGYIIKF